MTNTKNAPTPTAYVRAGGRAAQTYTVTSHDGSTEERHDPALPAVVVERGSRADSALNAAAMALVHTLPALGSVASC